MTATRWDNRFEDALRPFLPFLAPTEALPADLPLRDFGLDSLATIELLARLEDAFDVRFVDDALNLETFETAETLWAALEKLQLGVAS